jgi:hypothetical protein
VSPDDDQTCPACGGAGGGPFGRAGSSWDDEAYVCPRCKGLGIILTEEEAAAVSRPGIAKTAPPPRADAGAEKKRKTSA